MVESHFIVQNRSSRALKSFCITMGNTGLNMVLGFIFTPFILSSISSKSYGFWMTIVQTISILGIVDVGATIAITRKVADPKVVSDKNKFSRVVSSGLVIQVILALSILIIGILFSNNILALFGINIEIEQEANGLTAFLLMVCWSAISVLLGIINAVLYGRQEMTFVNSVVGISTIAGTLLVVLFLYMGLGLIAFPLSLIIPGFVGAIVLYLYMRRTVPSFNISISKISLTELKDLSTFSAYWWVSKLGYLILYTSDNIILSSTIGVDYVTLYVLNSRLSLMMGMISSQIANSAMAGIAELYATKNYERLQQVASFLINLSTRLGVFITVMVIFCNERLISLWVGSKYYGGIELTILLSIICFRNTFIGGIGTLIISSGNMRIFGWTFLIEGVLKVVLSLLLIPKFGMNGLALGHLIAVSCFGTFCFLYQISKLIKMSLKRLTYLQILKPAFYSIPSVFVFMLLKETIPITWGWWGLIIICIGGGVTNLLSFDLHKLRTLLNMDWTSRLRFFPHR